MRCIFHFLSALVQAGSNKYIFLHVFCDIMLEHMKDSCVIVFINCFKDMYVHVCCSKNLHVNI